MCCGDFGQQGLSVRLVGEEQTVLVTARADVQIECCDHETGRWRRLDDSKSRNVEESSGCHIVDDLAPGHTYSFRIAGDLSMSSCSAPVTISQGTGGSWEQDNLTRRYRPLEQVIGRGRTSQVILAEDRCTGHKVALKHIERSRQPQCTTRTEYQTLASINHKNIVRALALFENAPLPGLDTIILELVNGRDICSFVCLKETVKGDVIQSLMAQLISALDFLKNIETTHCDLKPENLLVETAEDWGGDSGKVTLTLVDFGSAVSSCSSRPPAVHADLEFTAPELHARLQLITPAADIWSAGVIFYVLISGVSPFLDESAEETAIHVKNADFSFPDEFFTDVPQSAKEFAASFFVLSPDSRPTHSEISRSLWMTENASLMSIKTSRIATFVERRQLNGMVQHMHQSSV